MSGGELRAYARDDGKVVVEVWANDERSCSWEMQADEAERCGHGLIAKAKAARKFAVGRVVDGPVSRGAAVSDCDAEFCPMWGGDECLCDVFGFDRDNLPRNGTFTVDGPLEEQS